MPVLNTTTRFLMFLALIVGLPMSHAAEGWTFSLVREAPKPLVNPWERGICGYSMNNQGEVVLVERDWSTGDEFLYYSDGTNGYSTWQEFHRCGPNDGCGFSSCTVGINDAGMITASHTDGVYFFPSTFQPGIDAPVLHTDTDARSSMRLSGEGKIGWQDTEYTCCSNFQKWGSLDENLNDVLSDGVSISSPSVGGPTINAEGKVAELVSVGGMLRIVDWDPDQLYRGHCELPLGRATGIHRDRPVDGLGHRILYPRAQLGAERGVRNRLGC